jgi:hypothetical protein
MWISAPAEMQTSSHAISYLYDERAGRATLFLSRLVAICEDGMKDGRTLDSAGTIATLVLLAHLS